MCIPATLPAAFLAFNQVFLSATPDHWCNVTELSNSGLSDRRIKNLAIPRVNMGVGRENFIVHEKCLQFDVNFTEVYINNSETWPKDPVNILELQKNWKKVPCKHGWIYDRSEYKDTLVTEVRLVFIFDFITYTYTKI